MQIEKFSIPSASKKNITGDLRFCTTKEKIPVVIICHGFMAFKDWGMYPFVGESFAKNNFASVTFNFSHNGISNNLNKITDYKNFEENTISKEISDLKILLNEIETGSLNKNFFNLDQIFLVAHSRGTGIAVLETANNKKIKLLATWSPISTFDRWTETQKLRWKQNGFLPATNNFSSHPLKIGIELLNNIESNKNKFNIFSAAKKISVPWLIIQGMEDLITPPKETEKIFSVANKDKTKYILLEKVGHLYNAMNKSKDDFQTISHILDITINFFKTNF